MCLFGSARSEAGRSNPGAYPTGELSWRLVFQPSAPQSFDEIRKGLDNSRIVTPDQFIDEMSEQPSPSRPYLPPSEP